MVTWLSEQHVALNSGGVGQEDGTLCTLMVPRLSRVILILVLVIIRFVLRV